MREAEVAVVQHYATEEQERRVRAMAGIAMLGEDGSDVPVVVDALGSIGVISGLRTGSERTA